MVRKVLVEDGGQIAEIYNYYILNTTVTFEEQELSETQMKERIEKISSSFPYLVFEENGKILGYAYATEWRVRSAYRYSVESSVYVHKDVHGKGIGKQLYTELLNQLKAKRIHAVIGGIVLPNPISISLHEKFGFIKVAQFKEVGFKFHQWLDVGYWELLFNN